MAARKKSTKKAARKKTKKKAGGKVVAKKRAPRKTAATATTAPVLRRARGGADEAPTLHLIKLCVGVSEIEELAEWQKQRRKQFNRRYNVHVTRAFPKRGEELLAGGSLYWVIQGRIRVRQRLIGIGEHVGNRDGDGGVLHCELQLDPKLIEVAPRHHRPFQGWRYLEAKDAPPDLDLSRKPKGDALPPALAEELRALGLL